MALFATLYISMDYKDKPFYAMGLAASLRLIEHR